MLALQPQQFCGLCIAGHGVAGASGRQGSTQQASAGARWLPGLHTPQQGSAGGDPSRSGLCCASQI